MPGFCLFCKINLPTHARINVDEESCLYSDSEYLCGEPKMTHTREHLTVSELTVISHEVRHSFFLRVRLKRHTLAFTVMSFSRGPKLHTPTKVSYPSSCWWWIGGSSIWCRVAERGGRVCEEFLSSFHGGSCHQRPREENRTMKM